VLATARPETRTEDRRRSHVHPFGGERDSRALRSVLSRGNLSVPNARDENHQRARVVLACGLKSKHLGPR
jgi:hypothetical protein